MSKGRGRPARAAAAAACALALGALAPAAALAYDATASAGTTRITMAGAPLATDDGTAGGTAFGNVAVTVATALPVSVASTGEVTGPSEGARIANVGQNDVRLVGVSARMRSTGEGRGDVTFTPLSKADFDASALDNIVYLGLTITSGRAGTNAADAAHLTLDEAVKEGGVTFGAVADGDEETGQAKHAWTIRPLGDGAEVGEDVVRVDADSRMAHISDAVAGQGRAPLASISWTFEPAGE